MKKILPSLILQNNRPQIRKAFPILIRWLSSTSSSKKESYVFTPGNMPLLGITIGQQLTKTATKFPDKEAIVVPHQNLRKNYTQFLKDVTSFAMGLLHIGLQKGDRLGILGANSYEWIITQFAAAHAGLILVTINNAYQVPELYYCLKKVGCKAIVSAATFKTQDYYKMFCEIIPDLSKQKPGKVHNQNLPHLNSIILTTSESLGGTYKFEDILAKGTNSEQQELEKLQKKIQFDDPAMILFTSGTTGNPKGATLSHFNIINNAYFVGQKCDYHTQDHRICITVPLYHCFGCILGTLSSVVHGACSILPAPRFDAAMTLKAVQDEKCTSLYGTPTMYIDMLNLPDFSQYNVSSLFTGIMAGSPCPTEIMKQVIDRLNMKNCTIAYGLTETSPVLIQTSSTDSVEKRVSSVGQPLPYIEIKIIDSEGQIVPVNTQGELLSRGYTTMLGYWQDEKKTKEVINQACWFSSGDIASMDEDGYVTIEGRIKDLVIRGGTNIYPTEIEQFLYTHPDIQDVQIIGVPDPRMGEEICAWIKLKQNRSANEETIKQFCKGKIAHFKIPRYILFVDEFPMTVTGKVQKFIMREKSLHLLNLKK